MAVTTGKVRTIIFWIFMIAAMAALSVGAYFTRKNYIAAGVVSGNGSLPYVFALDGLILVLMLLRRPVQSLLEEYAPLRLVMGLFVWILTPLVMFTAGQNMLQYEWELKTDKIVINLLIYYGLLLILTMIFRKLRTGSKIFIVLLTFLFVLNYYVCEFRGKPLTIFDVWGAKTATTVMMTYRVTFDLSVVIPLLCILALYTLVHQFQMVRFPVIRLKSFLFRLNGVIAGVLLILVVYRLALCNDYLKASDFWILQRTYARKGTVSTMLAEINYMKVDPPANYSVDKVEEIVADAREEQVEAEKAAAAAKKDDVVVPENLIIVMNESFSDPEYMGTAATDEELIPFWRSLDKNVIRGDLFVPIVGAGTSNTEYELLTSNCRAFIPMEVTPYESYCQDPEYGMALTLKAQGYRTWAVHPKEASNWNRNKVYPWMGFDEFLSLDNWDTDYELLRTVMSDQSCYERIVKEYKEKKKGEKLFTFCVTMQNHGSYLDESREGYEGRVKLDYDEDMPKAELYLALMQESDKAFKYLLEEFEKVDEPTMIVMFGDHQPYIEADYYRELKETHTGDMSVPYSEKRYVTPYVIWTNYDQPNVYQDMSSNYLGAYILQAAGLDMTTYNRYVLDVMDRLPILGYGSVRDSDGVWYSYEDLPEQYKDILAEYSIVQYNDIFDRKNILEDVFALGKTG
ncbi:MAG: LTA synthase family protein [Blautia sp.]|nr:LTA synthase family protein [Blautia sp.]